MLTGIDLDPEALRIRRDETKDLHEAIVGDLRTADFGQRTFDVIFNSYVLEHVPGAQQVLENFNRWVKPGGLIIIMIPDPYSAYGSASRMTPHSIHVLFYRLIHGQKNAGKPGYGPYPVTYDKVVSREGIRAFCGENGLVLAAEYGITGGLNNNSLKQKLVEAYKKTLQVLSLGRLSSDYNDIFFIIRKPALPARADCRSAAPFPPDLRVLATGHVYQAPVARAVQRRHASSVRPVSRRKARCSVRRLVPLSDAIRVRLSTLPGESCSRSAAARARAPVDSGRRRTISSTRPGYRSTVRAKLMPVQAL